MFEQYLTYKFTLKGLHVSETKKKKEAVFNSNNNYNYNKFAKSRKDSLTRLQYQFYN